VLGKRVSCAPRVSRASEWRLPKLDLGRMPSGIAPHPHQAVSSMMVDIRNHHGRYLKIRNELLQT
jgi:hypothetical protein